MANRNAPAWGFGNSSSQNHAKRQKLGNVTKYDPANGAATRVKGAKSPGAARTGVTAASADDLVTLAAHGFAVGQEVRFTAMTGGTPLVSGTSYYVIAAGYTAGVFRVSATPGGAQVDITVDMTAGTVTPWGYTYVGAHAPDKNRARPRIPGPR